MIYDKADFDAVAIGYPTPRIVRIKAQNPKAATWLMHVPYDLCAGTQHLDSGARYSGVAEIPMHPSEDWESLVDEIYKAGFSIDGIC